MTSGKIRSLVWFKNLAIPVGVLDKLGVSVLNKKIGHFKLINHIPKDLEVMLPKEFKDVKD